MQVWSARWLFVVLGAIYGSWAVRIPDVARHAHVSNGQLGAVLFALAVGSLIGMPAASMALRRFPLAVLVRVLSAAFAVAGIVLAAVPSLGVLVVAAVVFGSINGAYGIVINSAATALEAHGRRVVSSCHASFSVATLTASLLGGLLVAHVAPWLHLMVVGVICVIGAWVASAHLADVPRPDNQPRRHEVPRARLVWIASALAFVALFAEGVVTDWSAYFLQHALIGHPSPQQTWGYAGFSAAMALGRSRGDALMERVGESGILWGSICLAVAGYALVSLAPLTAVAITGFALIGAGLSNLYPAMISLSAARLRPGERDTAIAAVSGVGYFGFLVGPALLGGLAEAIGIRMAIATPILALAGAGVLLTGLLQEHPSRTGL